MGLIITQGTKYPDFKLDGINRIMNNLLEFLHSQTVMAMCSAEFPGTTLSILDCINSFIYIFLFTPNRQLAVELAILLGRTAVELPTENRITYSFYLFSPNALKLLEEYYHSCSFFLYNRK